LLFVGDGTLAHAVSGLEHEGIHHTGHLPNECVTDWLAAADLHLFASLVDVWGLVVSEAILNGTPTLCSIHAGCSDDVIGDGLDGWLFDPIDVDSWPHRLSVLLQSDDLAQLGARARISSRRFGIERMASGFRMAVQAVAGSAANQALETPKAG
jgi:glycosyltransferase involved in cell wall biosynthesis